MAVYETKKELRKELDKEVKKRRGDVLTEDEWRMVEPDDYPDAYDEKDLQEALSYLRIPQRLQRPPRKNLSIVPGEAILIREYIETIIYIQRDLFGLTKFVPLEKLGEYLSQFKVKQGGIALQYPVDRKRLADEDLDLWKIETIRVSEKNWRLLAAKGFIDRIAHLSSAHPAQVLALSLCGHFFYEDAVVVFLENGQINLKIRSPHIPAKTVEKIYLAVKKLPELHRKERGISERVRTLYNFIASHPEISWPERLERWNSEYPTWNYKSEASMKVVYSRVASLLNEVKESTEDFKERYEVFLKFLIKHDKSLLKHNKETKD